MLLVTTMVAPISILVVVPALVTYSHSPSDGAAIRFAGLRRQQDI